MNLATFRVEGEAAALDRVVQALGIDLDAQWRAGDRMRSGKIRDSAGFSGTVVDASSTRELEEALLKVSAQWAKARLNFPSLGLRATLSLGVSVGDSEQFLASVELPANLVATLGELGVGLAFNAYPTSDGANAT